MSFRNRNKSEVEFPLFPKKIKRKRVSIKDLNSKINLSTGTFQVSSSLVAPNKGDLMFCVSKAFKLLVEPFLKDESPVLDIFDEFRFPLDFNESKCENVTVEGVYEFMTDIFNVASITIECAVMSLAYVEKFIVSKRAKSKLTYKTWRRILLAAMIAADKVFEDLAVWNIDFIKAVPRSYADDLNKIERAFLSAICFRTTITASEYAKYYFALKELSDHRYKVDESAVTESSDKMEDITSSFQKNMLKHEKVESTKMCKNPKNYVHSSVGSLENLLSNIPETRTKEIAANENTDNY